MRENSLSIENIYIFILNMSIYSLFYRRKGYVFQSFYIYIYVCIHTCVQTHAQMHAHIKLSGHDKTQNKFISSEKIIQK